MDSFVKKTIKKQLNQMGILDFKLDKRRNYQNNCFIHIVYEHKKEIYAAKLKMNENYKNIESEILLNQLAQRVEYCKNWINSNLFQEQNYKYKNADESKNIAFFIKDQVKELRDMLNQPMNMSYQEKYSNNKVDTMLKSGISPLDIINQAKKDWSVRFKPTQNDIKKLEKLMSRD